MLSDTERAQLRDGMRRTTEKHRVRRGLIDTISDIVDDVFAEVCFGAKSGEGDGPPGE